MNGKVAIRINTLFILCWHNHKSSLLCYVSFLVFLLYFTLLLLRAHSLLSRSLSLPLHSFAGQSHRLISTSTKLYIVTAKCTTAADTVHLKIIIQSRDLRSLVWNVFKTVTNKCENEQESNCSDFKHRKPLEIEWWPNRNGNARMRGSSLKCWVHQKCWMKWKLMRMRECEEVVD